MLSEVAEPEKEETELIVEEKLTVLDTVVNYIKNLLN